MMSTSLWFPSGAVLLLLQFVSYGQESQFTERTPRYRLQPNDIIEVQYRYTPEFNQALMLQPDGFVTLQVIGEVKLSTLTLEEATALLVSKARTRLRDPEIVVVLKDFQKPYFVVAGEVHTSGRFDLRGNLTALDAIAIAGGFKSSAKRSQLVLYRRSNPRAETVILNVKSMMDDRNLTEDAFIQPGDVIWVPQNTISNLERYVRTFNFGAYISPWPR